MPTLDWIGKSKVVNHHLDVPYKVLENQYIIPRRITITFLLFPQKSHIIRRN